MGRVTNARPDVIARDFPLNHGGPLVSLAQTGVLVLAAFTAMAELVRVAPAAKPLVKGLVFLDLPRAKGKRQLKAKVVI